MGTQLSSLGLSHLNGPANEKFSVDAARARRAPGPRGHLLLGSLPEFRHDAIGFLSQSVDQYGDVVRFRFGPVNAHLLNHPTHVERALARGGNRYDKRTRSVSKIHATCGNSLLSSDGEPWLRHRRLIQPFFQPHVINSFVDVIDSEADALIHRWRQHQAAGKTIDIVSEMMRVTLTIASRIFFGADVREDTNVIHESLSTILDDTWRRLESPLDLSLISPRFHRRSFRRALRQLDRVVYQIIHDRRAGGQSRDDLLSALLSAHESLDSRRLSDRELRDAVITLLLAGHETTANALAWTCYLISQSPHVEQIIQHHPSSSGQDVGASTSLPHAAMAFQEAIRMYPSIWIIERRVVEDDVVDGFFIPQGSTILISPYLLHRHRDHWPNPENFDPNRFSESNVSDRPRHVYIPFGAGPHKCIGQHMALLIASRILSRIYQDFQLRLVPGQTVKMLPGITLRHRSELRMQLRLVHADVN